MDNFSLQSIPARIASTHIFVCSHVTFARNKMLLKELVVYDKHGLTSLP